MLSWLLLSEEVRGATGRLPSPFQFTSDLTPCPPLGCLPHHLASPNGCSQHFYTHIPKSP
jgi:hypothetical protein